MKELKLYDAEYKFMNIIWRSEPINSTELVKICKTELGWKKSTTYTVLRKLKERKILKNENATVTSLVNKNDVQKYESETLLKKTFDNSLPKFLTAFLQDKKITSDEAKELKQIIDMSWEE